MDDPEDEILLGDTLRIVCTSHIGSHGTSNVVTGRVVDVADDNVVVSESDESEVVIPLSSIREWDLMGLNAHRLDPVETSVLVRVYPGDRQSDAAGAVARAGESRADHHRQKHLPQKPYAGDLCHRRRGRRGGKSCLCDSQDEQSSQKA